MSADPLDPEAIAAAYLAACRAELEALKPGNVHSYAAGHGMTPADFLRSAEASAPALVDPAAAVGERVRGAIWATHRAVGANTNLGIVLLAAPLAAAAAAPGAGDLRAGLGRVLGALDRDDAEAVFAAIRLAAPGGLGRVDEHDVRAPATVTLLEAMRAAAGRDLVARQYANGYAEVFDLGVPRLRAGRARHPDLRWATVAAYLGFLSAFPDSHVVRRHGPEVAESVRLRACDLDRAFDGAEDLERLRPRLLALDRELKRQGVNPGTSADLTVASLLALGLEERDGRISGSPLATLERAAGVGGPARRSARFGSGRDRPSRRAPPAARGGRRTPLPPPPFGPPPGGWAPGWADDDHDAQGVFARGLDKHGNAVMVTTRTRRHLVARRHLEQMRAFSPAQALEVLADPRTPDEPNPSSSHSPSNRRRFHGPGSGGFPVTLLLVDYDEGQLWTMSGSPRTP